MDFIFMLTSDDRTVPDGLEALDAALALGIRHVGFKDVGAAPETLGAINRRIKAAGGTSYIEVVSLSSEESRLAARSARAFGVDCLLGGNDMPAMAEIIADTPIAFFPFVGRPDGHPTRLAGDGAAIDADCRRAAALGCAGIDLLAYRAVDAEPLDLVRAARAALPGRRLIVAGSIDSPARIAALAAAGADAFTIGSALFQRRFAPGEPTLAGQLAAVLAACPKASR